MKIKQQYYRRKIKSIKSKSCIKVKYQKGYIVASQTKLLPLLNKYNPSSHTITKTDKDKH